ncbi:MAG: type II secretion system protein [Salinisphaeraceae bacterium]
MKLKYTPRFKAARQKGFTLVELAIVVVILGIVAGIIATRFTGSAAASARAEAIETFAGSAGLLASTVNTQLGLPATMDSAHPAVDDNGNSWLDVIVDGRDFIDADFQQGYDRTGAGSLRDAVAVVTEPAVGTPGVYEVEGYEVQIDDAKNVTDGEATFTFIDVPANVVQAMVETIEPADAYAAGGEANGDLVYGAVAGGLHPTVDVTVDIR